MLTSGRPFLRLLNAELGVLPRGNEPRLNFSLLACRHRAFYWDLMPTQDLNEHMGIGEILDGYEIRYLKMAPHRASGRPATLSSYQYLFLADGGGVNIRIRKWRSRNQKQFAICLIQGIPDYRVCPRGTSGRG